MSDAALDRAVGARMKAAAQAKGYTQVVVAEMMGREQSTVSRWFRGELIPDKTEMNRYAEVIGVSEGWLWTGREELTPALLADTVAECLLRVTKGEAPSAAFDQMTHEPWHLTPERRRVVDAAAEQIRQYVATSVPEWDALSEYEQRQTLRRLLAPEL